MAHPVAATISPREMIGLAELCENAGDRSFAVLMVECAFTVLSADRSRAATMPDAANDPHDLTRPGHDQRRD